MANNNLFRLGLTKGQLTLELVTKPRRKRSTKRKVRRRK